MILVAQQPNYFPWLGYFEQLRIAETFAVLDSVQWIRQGVQHRTRIAPQKSSPQEFLWLTLPVHGHGHREKPLKEIQLDKDQPWTKEHWRSIQSVYGRAPFFESQLEPVLEPFFAEAQKFSTMAEASLASVKIIAEVLEIWPKRVVYSSTLRDHTDPTDRLVSICQELGATTYYTALGTALYLDNSRFRAADIRVIQQKFRTPEYRNISRTLSVIDVLAHVPLEKIREWIEPKEWGPFPHRRSTLRDQSIFT